jgi:hypothetical protein
LVCPHLACPAGCRGPGTQRRPPGSSPARHVARRVIGRPEGGRRRPGVLRCSRPARPSARGQPMRSWPLQRGTDRGPTGQLRTSRAAATPRSGPRFYGPLTGGCATLVPAPTALLSVFDGACWGGRPAAYGAPSALLGVRRWPCDRVTGGRRAAITAPPRLGPARTAAARPPPRYLCEQRFHAHLHTCQAPHVSQVRHRCRHLVAPCKGTSSEPRLGIRGGTRKPR